KLAKRIHYSKSLRVALEEICNNMEVKYKTIKHPVATRWNTHTVMLQSMIALCGPLATLADDHKGLTKLSAEEWKVLVGLEDVLRPFLILTKRFEDKSRPLLHEFIPALDIATRNLEKVIQMAAHLPVIHMAAARGLVVVDKYYAKTDDSLMYRLAMSEFLSYPFVVNNNKIISYASET
ncbi:hypothetical protein BT96DRAFT_835757, partial [Gymnopus androsaceus JB14]